MKRTSQRSHRTFRSERRVIAPTTVELLERRRLLSATPDFVPGELLVAFEPGVGQADIARFYAKHGVAERKGLDAHVRGNASRLKLVSVPAERTAAMIPALEADPRVRFAEPNYLASTSRAPNDPDFAREWGLLNTGQTTGTPDADIDADEAWDITTGSPDGAEIVVGVLDSGVDYTHPDLVANMWTNPGEIPGNKKDDDDNGYVDDVHGYDFVNRDGQPLDDLPHGTHVAGTIGMSGDNGLGGTGVNWGVRLMALKFIGSNNVGSYADAIEAMNYTIMMRGRGVDIRLTNNSWAGTDFSQALQDAIDASGQAGMLFVAAASNETADNELAPAYPASFDSPNIISVAATDSDDQYAWFSNWGATTVDLAAPGENIWSTVPGGNYDWSGGTSMASPHVAGAAALVWSEFPELTAAEVKERLLNGVDPIGHIGNNPSRPTLTNGRLNVRNALVVPGPDAGDSTAPAPLGDVSASAASPWSATLTWTATGDDGAAGRAGFYDVRYASTPITESTWAAASAAVSEPAPRGSGAAETFIATGLEPGTRYYFAAKVKDNAGNESTLSNLAQAQTTAATFLLNEDVESAAGAFVPDGLWHRSGRRGYDSATAWHYAKESDGNYETGTPNTGTLTLATPLDLTDATEARLSYQEFRQPGMVPVGELALVQVSRDGGEWETVVLGNYPVMQWERRTVDLTPYVGGLLSVRFLFDSNDAGLPPELLLNDLEGWYVDNLQVLVPAATPAGVSVNNVTVTEGHAGTVEATFTISRPAGGGAVSVNYATADGRTTVAGQDYQATSGVLAFAAGETTKTVTVLVAGDRLAEEDESFALRLTGAGVADGEGIATIIDDEPRLYLITPWFFGEGGDKGVTPAGVLALLTAPSDTPVTLGYSFRDDTALAGSDYDAAGGTLTFGPGETIGVLPLGIVRDKRAEAMEKFFVDLSPVTDNVLVARPGVILIEDDDKSQGHHREKAGAPAAAAWLSGRAAFSTVRITVAPTRPSTWAMLESEDSELV